VTSTVIGRPSASERPLIVSVVKNWSGPSSARGDSALVGQGRLGHVGDVAGDDLAEDRLVGVRDHLLEGVALDLGQGHGAQGSEQQSGHAQAGGEAVGESHQVCVGGEKVFRSGDRAVKPNKT